MLDYIELAPNQTIDNLLPTLLIGHTYYVNDSTSNEYNEYVLVPKKKEYVGLIYDKDKVTDILTNKLEKEFLGVDLELPSGTIWAKCNVGAEKPSDAGLFFQWGDTVGYTAEQVGKDKQFSWSDYKWYESGSTTDNSIKFKKYTTKGATLELEDDAAHVNMGGDWHMPSPDQIQELIDNTTSTWTTQDGINGRLFTSKKNGKSIFIPVAGDVWDGSVTDRSMGYVLSSMLGTRGVSGVQGLYFGSGNMYLHNNYNRRDGLSVRGVIG